MKHVIKTYENYKEEDRLTMNYSRKIEFVTTMKALQVHLPKSAKVLDVGAGTGIYSFELAKLGYDVTALDITPRHVEWMNCAKKETGIEMNTLLGNATDLSGFDDQSFDVVLLMGPIYHLADQGQRDLALDESIRVLKRDGLLIVSYINRFFMVPYRMKTDIASMDIDSTKSLIQTGILKSTDPNCFWTDTFLATPNLIETYLNVRNVSIIDHLGTDGISRFIDETMDNLSEEDFDKWCQYHYLICRESTTLGNSNHGLVIGRK